MTSIRRLLKVYRSLIISLSIIVVSAVILIFVGVPAVKATIVRINQVQTLSQDVQALRTRITYLDSMDEELLFKQLSTLTSAVPTEKSVASAIATIEETMAQSGISVTDISFTKTGSLATDAAKLQTAEEKQIGISLLPFTVTSQGSLDAFRLFLTKIITVRRFLRVDSIDVVANNPNAVTIRLAMDAFYVPLSVSKRSDAPLIPLTSEEEEFLGKVAGLPLASRGLSTPPPQFLTGQLKSNPFSPLP